MPRILFFALIAGFSLLLDYYTHVGFSRLSADSKNPRLKKSLSWAAWLITALKILSFVVLFVIYGLNYREFQGTAAFFSALMFILFIPQMIFTLVMLAGDVFRFGEWGYRKTKQVVQKEDTSSSELRGRRKFVSQMALGIASIPFFSVLHGVTRGKYAYTVRKVKLAFKDLPEKFHGFTLTQISDVHSGSFDNAEKVSRGIDMINEQGSDLIVFTGDLVNNKADEMQPWIEIFSRLDAPFGKYSILGNHDYGHYAQWPDKDQEEANFQRLKETHKEMGFKLLLNEHEVLEKEGDKIALLGVENWGKAPFPQYGDIDLAVQGAEDIPIKILLSHDPSHWDERVIEHKEKIHLTLSGHTHGMQFGIEIPGIKWSPVKYRYPRWAGLYEQAEQYLYVNRGFGFIGFPGRVGIWPEITVIEFQKA